MTNEQNNNQDLSTNPQTPETTTQTTKDNRFDYMNQKPHYTRKQLTMLGVALTMVLALVMGSAFFVVSSAIEAFAQSDIGQTIADFTSKKEEVPEQEENVQETMLESRQFAEELVVNNPDEADANDAAPEYTEESIALALYEVPLSDHIVVTTSTEEKHAGYYALRPDTVYAICWDASPLYINSEGDVEADITISSDFLIGGGIDGEGMITVNIRDYHRHIDYVGELHVASEYGNLGIEFCADQCRRYSYGFDPQIEDKKFTVCFYTSGEYVESVSDGRYSVDGHYGFTYGTDGSALQNDVVTSTVPTPMPYPSYESDETKNSDYCDHPTNYPPIDDSDHDVEYEGEGDVCN